MKKFIPHLVLIFGLLIAHRHMTAQVFSTLDHPFAWFEGTTEPDADWYMPEYDDSGWETDTGIIGYGYYYDGAPIEDILISPSVSSMYLRCHFYVEDKETFTEANLLTDYDDGFIAYLNGKEILRVNIAEESVHPAFDDLAIRSHEMQLYGWDNYPVPGYFLDSLQLDSCLTEGENVLAVQVLNDSTDGSDFQFLCELHNITNTHYDIYSILSRYKRQFKPDSTSLPIVVIETDEFGLPYHHIRRNAFMGIIDNGEGNYNLLTDSCNVYYGMVSIEVRGESSKEFPKRSYRFELIDETGADTNVTLLGMPANDDWILLGPMHDKALFRNPMVFDMGRRLNGSYQPRDRFCEVYFNGEYIGLYSLLETIKRGPDRVNIARLRPEEIGGNDLTGGYILRFDKPIGYLQIVYPRPDDLQPEQEAYILGYYDEFSETLRKSYFMDPEIGFRKYLNDTSLVDYLIVNEITKNADSYLFSTYFYKDRDDRDPRFHYGPLWDMNLAFGNSIYHLGDRTDEWQFDNSEGNNNRTKAKKMFQDPAMVDLFQERWWAARAGVFSTDSLLAYIDSMVVSLEEPRIRNYEVWPVIDKDIFHPNYQSMSYEEEIMNIKNWLVDRLDWIDANIDDLFYEVVIPDEIPQGIQDIQFSYEVYPNPFRDQLILEAGSDNPTELQLYIYDLVGTCRYIKRIALQTGRNYMILDDKMIQDIPSGVYLLRVNLNGSPFATQRLVKE